MLPVAWKYGERLFYGFSLCVTRHLNVNCWIYKDKVLNTRTTNVRKRASQKRASVDATRYSIIDKVITSQWAGWGYCNLQFCHFSLSKKSVARDMIKYITVFSDFPAEMSCTRSVNMYFLHKNMDHVLLPFEWTRKTDSNSYKIFSLTAASAAKLTHLEWSRRTDSFLQSSFLPLYFISKVAFTKRKIHLWVMKYEGSLCICCIYV